MSKAAAPDKPRKQKFSREEVRRELQRFCHWAEVERGRAGRYHQRDYIAYRRECPQAPTPHQLHKHYPESYWGSAMRDVAASPASGIYADRAHLEARAREFAAQLGHPPTVSDWRTRRPADSPSLGTIYTMYGSYREFLRRARADAVPARKRRRSPSLAMTK